MKINALAIPVGAVLAVGGLPANAAFAPGSTLTIEKGSNFTMEVSPGFQLKTAITGHAGIIVGTAQATGASHAGPVTGSEAIASSIDNPWVFFGNTGLDFTVNPANILSSSGNQATVDFSGWRVTWNGVPSINMGGDAWGGNASGVANVTFGADGSDGDTYTLTYTATVPRDGQTNFGGIRYGLNLKGRVIAPAAAPAPAPSATPSPTAAPTSGQAPIIDAVPASITAVVGQPLQYKLTALSPQDHSYTWAGVGLPPGASFSPAEGAYDSLTRKWSASLSWTPSPAQAGRHPVAFTVKDNNTGLTSAAQATFIEVVSFGKSKTPFDNAEPTKRIAIAAARFDKASSKLLVKGKVILKKRSNKATGRTVEIIDTAGTRIGTAEIAANSTWSLCTTLPAAPAKGTLLGAQHNGLVDVRKVVVASKLKNPCK